MFSVKFWNKSSTQGSWSERMIRFAKLKPKRENFTLNELPKSDPKRKRRKTLIPLVRAVTCMSTDRNIFEFSY